MEPAPELTTSNRSVRLVTGRSRAPDVSLGWIKRRVVCKPAGLAPSGAALDSVVTAALLSAGPTAHDLTEDLLPVPGISHHSDDFIPARSCCFALVHCLGASYDEDRSGFADKRWNVQATDLRQEGS